MPINVMSATSPALSGLRRNMYTAAAISAVGTRKNQFDNTTGLDPNIRRNSWNNAAKRSNTAKMKPIKATNALLNISNARPSTTAAALAIHPNAVPKAPMRERPRLSREPKNTDILSTPAQTKRAPAAKTMPPSARRTLNIYINTPTISAIAPVIIRFRPFIYLTSLLL